VTNPVSGPYRRAGRYLAMLEIIYESPLRVIEIAGEVAFARRERTGPTLPSDLVVLAGGCADAGSDAPVRAGLGCLTAPAAVSANSPVLARSGVCRSGRRVTPPSSPPTGGARDCRESVRLSNQCDEIWRDYRQPLSLERPHPSVRSVRGIAVVSLEGPAIFRQVLPPNLWCRRLARKPFGE
jgi:hypothetical protein